MSKVFLDTNIFIYLIEDQGTNGRRVAALLDRLSARRDSVYTSALTLGELLVKPVTEGHVSLAAEYEAALTPPSVTLLGFDRGAARRYAEIRLDKSIKAPDATQLAVASSAEIDLFITNDERLSRKIVSGIHFIASLEKVPF